MPIEQLDPVECEHCNLTWLPGEHPQHECVAYLTGLLRHWYGCAYALNTPLRQETHDVILAATNDRT